jgi:integrase/recombinase XerD
MTRRKNLTISRKLSASSISTATSALRFLYRVTLKQHWSPDGIPMPKKPLKLPVVLSPVEVMHFLDCIENLKHRALLMTAYAAMAGNFGTSMAYQAACALVFKGLEQPL